MIREIIQESKVQDILKYFPKKLAKRYKQEVEQANTWVEAMDYPMDSGWYGHYGEKAGAKLEFNVKTYLNYDMEEVKSILGEDTEESDLEFYIEDYYNMGREDLEESLKSEFGISVFGYDGRQGGYILLDDWEEAMYKGTGAVEVHPNEDDGYIQEVQDWIDDVEADLADIAQIGPLDEEFEERVDNFEYILDELPYDVSISKKYDKILNKNYNTLEKFINDSVKSFGDYFIDFLKNNYNLD